MIMPKSTTDTVLLQMAIDPVVTFPTDLFEGLAVSVVNRYVYASPKVPENHMFQTRTLIANSTIYVSWGDVDSRITMAVVVAADVIGTCLVTLYLCNGSGLEEVARYAYWCTFADNTATDKEVASWEFIGDVRSTP
jgi:hypothetical protein